MEIVITVVLMIIVVGIAGRLWILMDRKVSRDSSGEVKIILEKNVRGILEEVNDFYTKEIPEGIGPYWTIDKYGGKVLVPDRTSEAYLYERDYREALRGLDESYEKMFEEALGG